MRTPILKIIAFGVASLFLKAPALQAGERTDFRVNDDGGITAQSSPTVAVAGDHTFVIGWVDRRDGTSDIYLQRYGSDGYAIGSNVKINDDTNASYQFEPAIAVDLSGLYSLVWKDYRNNVYPYNPDIYFQRFDSSVAKSGVNLNLTTETPDTVKETPAISLAPWGEGVVVWADYRNGNWDIYGQRFAADGSQLGSNFRVNGDVGTAAQHYPRVSVSPQGWFVVTWYDNRLGNDDIFVQRFNSSGSKVGVEIKVNVDAFSARQAFPDVAADGAGHFTVAWVDWRNGTYPNNPDIYARRYDTAMVALTGELKLNTDGTSNAQREPAIAADRMGNVVAIWADSGTTSWDITGQMIGEDGIVHGANFRANTDADSSQLTPDVALDGSYRYVTWVDKRNGNWDIYASIQKYNDPTLVITPEALKFEMQPVGGIPPAQDVTIESFGLNPLVFTVSSSVSWLTMTPALATTPDTVAVAVNTHDLAVGTYFGVLTFADTLNHDSTVVMSVRLDVVDSFAVSYDTLRVESATVQRNSSGNTSVTGTLTNYVSHISLPLSYDNDLLEIDSILPGQNLPENISFSAEIDAGSGLAAIDWEILAPDTTFDIGDYHLAELFFSTANTVTTAVIDTALNDSLVMSVFTAGRTVSPVFVSGEITITTSTPVEDSPDAVLPSAFELRQNHPNPFNLSTVIEYSVPAASEVTLDVFNILGQRVVRLVSGFRSAGEYTASWDGQIDNGQTAPSGVYFYRLETGASSEVRKMLLLK